MLARKLLGPMTTHLAGGNTAGLPQSPYPSDDRIRPKPKMLRRLMARQSTAHNRGDRPLTKVH